jgi:hypothetical protein
VAPYLTLMREDAPQRGHCLRKVFNGLRYIVRGHAVAHDAPRPAAVACGVSAGAVLAEDRHVQSSLFLFLVIHDLKVSDRNKIIFPPSAGLFCYCLQPET